MKTQNLFSSSFKFASLLMVFAILQSGSTFAQDGANTRVSLTMDSYQDLLNRIDNLETRVQAAESSTAQQFMGPQVNQAQSGGFYGTYEHVLIKPVFSNNTAFYVHDINVAASEEAILREFSWGLDSSHRLELGYLNPSSNLGWRTRYWFFDTDSSRTSSADVDVKVGVADDPDIAIDTVSAGDDDFYIANAALAIDVVDFEGFSDFQVKNAMMTFSGGVRYARIEHYYHGFDINPGNPIQAQLRAMHNFNGVGPTLSFKTRKQIEGTNFGWNLSGRGSLLIGSGDARWDRFSSFGVGGDSDAIIHEGSMRILPVAEMTASIDYAQDLGSTQLIWSTGVEAQAWINGGTAMHAGQDGATDSDHISSPWSEDLGFLGLFLRASGNY